MQSLLSRAMGITALASLPAALMAMIMPHSPAVAGNGFETCVSQLYNTGIGADQAAGACADALIPRELSACVRNIQGNTQVNGETALEACLRTRRPVELAQCVRDINRILPKEESASDEPVLLAVDTCRRSILPQRHAQCVVGLSRELQQLSPVDAMATCISAEDFPRDLFPSYTE
ncbi:MAG: hypothetical protein DSM107014_11935 [Gomphosphaeria aponina SAG 52.96 = DSM 107014]|uniref:Uncharacterized protein n=1 Tax=Gomphosphaeria aponina SAG 52.96 = DSM 107014 TaxID=1521640 RepID=A0A941GW67_9CHRO|nr:hypothetical protein [Gomphosphaeria aponina SAG 52.96 = DSM 107014]